MYSYIDKFTTKCRNRMTVLLMYLAPAVAAAVVDVAVASIMPGPWLPRFTRCRGLYLAVLVHLFVSFLSTGGSC